MEIERVFEYDSVKEITLLTVEQAERLPLELLACGRWWWLRSPGDDPLYAAGVNYFGSVDYTGNFVDYDSVCVRPAFLISDLNSKLGTKVQIENCICTVIDKDLALADDVICEHRFDAKSSSWESSELKAFIESDEFKRMLICQNEEENEEENTKVALMKEAHQMLEYSELLQKSANKILTTLLDNVNKI